MEDCDLALAARRHAGQTRDGSAREDPELLAGLAQSEAQLAVAAAIGRLAGVPPGHGRGL